MEERSVADSFTPHLQARRTFTAESLPPISNSRARSPILSQDSVCSAAISFLTGRKGKCSCYDGFGCNNCGARMLLDDYGEYTTIRNLIDGSINSVDICDVEWGGGYCTEDSECHGKGLCIENQCVCYSNWLCPYCEMGLNEDILIGATCGDYVHGGGTCYDDDDCNGRGVCLDGACMCNSGYVCSHCSSLALDVIKGSRFCCRSSRVDAICPCDRVNCGKHGVCEGGVCICEAGYKGQYCNINVPYPPLA